MLHKKRDRNNQSVIITLGRLQKGYYYINDSLNEGTKIKIPIKVINEEKTKAKIEQIEENSPDNNLSSHFIPEKTEINDKKLNENYIPMSSSWFDFDEINPWFTTIEYDTQSKQKRLARNITASISCISKRS